MIREREIALLCNSFGALRLNVGRGVRQSRLGAD